jgi:hypothetical protein
MTGHLLVARVEWKRRGTVLALQHGSSADDQP